MEMEMGMGMGMGMEVPRNTSNVSFSRLRCTSLLMKVMESIADIEVCSYKLVHLFYVLVR